MRPAVAIISTILSLLLWWNQSSETDLFQINERVNQISTVLDEHAAQIKGLNEKTLSFDKGEELKKFVKPRGEGGFLEGVGKFFESFGSPSSGEEGEKQIEQKKQELEAKIVELQEKINSWEAVVSKQAEATRLKLAEMSRQTTELSQRVSTLKIQEGFLSGPRIRWWTLILSLVMTVMAWISAFWEENPEEEEVPGGSAGGGVGPQPAPGATPTAPAPTTPAVPAAQPPDDEVEDPPTYRAIKQVTVYGHAPDFPQILWEGLEVEELERLYPRTGDARTAELRTFSCSDFEEKYWFEVKTRRGWRICEDPRTHQ